MKITKGSLSTWDMFNACLGLWENFEAQETHRKTLVFSSGSMEENLGCHRKPCALEHPRNLLRCVMKHSGEIPDLFMELLMGNTSGFTSLLSGNTMRHRKFDREAKVGPLNK
jgi:hypothetical protein